MKDKPAVAAYWLWDFSFPVFSLSPSIMNINAVVFNCETKLIGNLIRKTIIESTLSTLGRLIPYCVRRHAHRSATLAHARPHTHEHAHTRACPHASMHTKHFKEQTNCVSKLTVTGAAHQGRVYCIRRKP